jgi:hypothetical protein
LICCYPNSWVSIKIISNIVYHEFERDLML